MVSNANIYIYVQTALDLGNAQYQDCVHIDEKITFLGLSSNLVRAKLKVYSPDELGDGEFR